MTLGSVVWAGPGQRHWSNRWGTLGKEPVAALLKRGKHAEDLASIPNRIQSQFCNVLRIFELKFQSSVIPLTGCGAGDLPSTVGCALFRVLAFNDSMV